VEGRREERGKWRRSEREGGEGREKGKGRETEGKMKGEEEQEKGGRYRDCLFFIKLSTGLVVPCKR